MDRNTQRLYYFDWIRVLAFGLLFLYHVARIFDTVGWHIKNVTTSYAFTYFNDFTHSWRMPLIFLISGSGTYFALRTRKEGFLKDRVMRLIVPYIFGAILLSPFQSFFDTLPFASVEGSYLDFLANYPGAMFAELGYTNPYFLFRIGYHLWYLAYLFGITILLFPVIKFLFENERAQALVAKFMSGFTPFITLMIVLIAVEFTSRPSFGAFLGWSDFANYTLFFFVGFLLQINRAPLRIIDEYTWVFLAVALLIWFGSSLSSDTAEIGNNPTFSWSFFLFIVLKSINCLAWIFAFIGLGKKFLNFTNKWLVDCNQGLLPFYILHQPVIILVAYYMVQWQLSMTSKFLLILIVSLMITIGLYQIIYRVEVLRVCFGMKKRSIAEKQFTSDQLTTAKIVKPISYRSGR
ncbi:MAG TPA: acyltransferase family protein [Chryseolinea sp.]|nr:acyltransferase family protein [Chryseolinea sp.]